MVKRYFAIQAIGKDRPGLVTTITGVVCEEMGCNVETSLMTILGGHFAATLIASTTDSLEETDLTAAFNEVDLGPFVGEVYVSRLAGEDFRPAWRGASYEVTLEASERTGLVYKTSKALADQEINITSLTSSCGVDGSRCTVVMDVVLSGEMGAAELEGLLRNALPADIRIEIRPALHSTWPT